MGTVSASGQVSGLAGRPTPGVIFASAKAAAGKAWACRSEPGLVGPWTGSKLGKQAVCLDTGRGVVLFGPVGVGDSELPCSLPLKNLKASVYLGMYSGFN